MNVGAVTMSCGSGPLGRPAKGATDKVSGPADDGKWTTTDSRPQAAGNGTTRRSPGAVGVMDAEQGSTSGRATCSSAGTGWSADGASSSYRNHAEAAPS